MQYRPTRPLMSPMSSSVPAGMSFAASSLADCSTHREQGAPVRPRACGAAAPWSEEDREIIM
eukprot:2802619-Prymnesium_polylepis.1